MCFNCYILFKVYTQIHSLVNQATLVNPFHGVRSFRTMLSSYIDWFISDDIVSGRKDRDSLALVSRYHR